MMNQNFSSHSGACVWTRDSKVNALYYNDFFFFFDKKISTKNLVHTEPSENNFQIWL